MFSLPGGWRGGESRGDGLLSSTRREERITENGVGAKGIKSACYSRGYLLVFSYTLEKRTMPAIMEAIDKMSMAEKVEVMNYLWLSVSSSGERVVPVWHIENIQQTAKPIRPRVSQYGALKGKVGMASDFDAPLEDFAEYM